ncbi:MAG TPA: hypothetical protein VMQ65_01595 [Candidatus Limnocylindria bacterium]|nr:hypothetical protein [Candidatus Limnocylindria bacterium]
MTKALSRLEDFRLLPVFVVVSMAIGIGLGSYERDEAAISAARAALERVLR